MSKYKVLEDGGEIGIGYSDANSTLECFIDIYPSEPPYFSPFKTKEECRLFAEIMVKILEIVE